MADHDNSEKQRLEVEKMKIELELLKKELEAENSGKTLGKRIKEWMPLGLTFIGIIGGLFTFWYNAEAYLDEIEQEKIQAREQYEIIFDREIVELIDDLNDEDRFKREYAALMLTSYNLQSIPVLMFMLERKQPMENEIYIRTIKNIYRKPTVDKDTLFNRMIASANNLFMHEYTIMDSTLDNFDTINFHGLENHILLFKELAAVMNSCQKDSARKMLVLFEEKLNEKDIHTFIRDLVENPIQVTLPELQVSLHELDSMKCKNSS